MKKNIFILLCLILNIAILCTSCGKDNEIIEAKKEETKETVVPAAATENPLYDLMCGRWQYTADVTEALLEINSDFEQYAQYAQLDKCEMIVNYDFTADGNLSLSVDEDSINSVVQNIKDFYTHCVDNMVAEQAALNNFTVEEYYYYSGLSRDNLIESCFSYDSFKESFEEVNSNLRYKIDCEYLYLYESEETFSQNICIRFEVSKDTLNLLEVVSNNFDEDNSFSNDYYNTSYPMELKKYTENSTSSPTDEVVITPTP